MNITCMIPLKMEMTIFLIIFILNTCNSQYNIIRINPLKKLSESLTTHHEEQQDGEYMSLQCPEGTKVVICLAYQLSIFFYFFFQISINSAHYGSRPVSENLSSRISDSLHFCLVRSFIHFVELECQTKQNCTFEVSEKKIGVGGSQSCSGKL